MEQTRSLLDLPFEEALDVLAYFKTQGQTMSREKLAETDILGLMGQNPGLTASLAGGLGGAGLGALATSSANRRRPEADRRSLWRGALMGGLTGAAIGGGGAALRAGLSGRGQSGTVRAPAGPPVPVRMSDGTTRHFTISPNAVREAPELYQRLRDSSQPSVLETVAGGAGSVASRVPWLSYVGGAGLIADRMLDSTRMRLGNLGLPGMVSPEHIKNPEAFRAGIQPFIDTLDEADPKRALLRKLVNGGRRSQGALDILARSRGTRGMSGGVWQTRSVQGPLTTVVEYPVNRPGPDGQAGEPVGPGQQRTVTPPPRNERIWSRARISPEDVQRINRLGAESWAQTEAGNAYYEGARPNSRPRFRRSLIPGLRDTHHPTGTFGRGRLGGRLGAFVAMPAALGLLGHLNSSSNSRSQEVQQVLTRLQEMGLMQEARSP